MKLEMSAGFISLELQIASALQDKIPIAGKD